MTVDNASLFLPVSPLPCLTRSVLASSPSPSHPTVRAVFPSPAVRPSSPSTMHRLRHVLPLAAAAVGEPHRLPLAIRIAFPSDPPAFPSLGEVATQTTGDEALSRAEGVTRVGVPARVAPSRHPRIDWGHECLRTHRRASRGEVFQLVASLLLGGLGRKEGEGVLATRGTLAFDKLNAKAFTALGQAGLPRLVPVEGPRHPFRHRRKGRQGRSGTLATDQQGSIRVPMECRSELRGRRAAVPEWIEESQVTVAVQRRDW